FTLQCLPPEGGEHFGDVPHFFVEKIRLDSSIDQWRLVAVLVREVENPITGFFVVMGPQGNGFSAVCPSKPKFLFLLPFDWPRCELIVMRQHDRGIENLALDSCVDVLVPV